MNFFYSPIENAEIQLEYGQMTSRDWTGHNSYSEFLVGEDGCVLDYFGYHHSGYTTFFMYPSDEMSEMFKDIIRNIDIWNFPSVKEQWPYFSKAYENGKNNVAGKVKIIDVKDAYTGDNCKVFAITFNRHIPFEPTLNYRQAIHQLAEYASTAIKEVLDDNGCLNLKGQIKSFLRGSSSYYLLKKLFS